MMSLVEPLQRPENVETNKRAAEYPLVLTTFVNDAQMAVRFRRSDQELRCRLFLFRDRPRTSCC